MNSSARVLPAGTVVLSRTASVGFVTVMGRPMATSQDFVNWVCGPELDPSFLALIFIVSRQFIRSLGSGAVHKTVYVPTVQNFYVCVPPLPVQKRIVAIIGKQLEVGERAHAAAEARLEAANALPGAYLREIFDDDSSRRWPIRTLSEISEIAGGVQKSPVRAPVHFHRPYLTVRNIQRGYLDLARVERFEIAPDELARLRLLPGDILIVEGNGSLDHIGRNALFVGDEQEWIHQNHVIRVRLDRTIARPEFVSRYLNSDAGRRQMIGKAKTTSGLYTLSTGRVGALEVPLPTLEEEDRVLGGLSEHVREAENLTAAAKRECETIVALRAALLRRAFSGGL